MSKKVKDHVGELHDYDIFLPTRTLFFFSDIDENNVHTLIKNLHILDNSGTETVTIKLYSEGGDVTAGLSAINAIRAMKSYVRIVCYGEVSSMATVLLQAADERVMMPDSILMIHEGSQSISGHPKNNEAWLKYYKQMDNRCYEIYLEKINDKRRQIKKKKMTKEELKKLLEFDSILTAQQAVSLGLADRIMEESY